jgi:hypothetical protein
MPERREHKRIKKRIQVMYGEEVLDQRAFASDVSIGGLFLICRPPPLGTRLHLHILDKVRDFYVEAEVVRQRRVDPRMRTVEKEGAGLRFLTPAELIAEAIPKTERTETTGEVVLHDPAPASGTIVEFVIRVEIGAGAVIEGHGRVVQILGAVGDEQRAVLEIQDAATVRAALETAVS